MSAPIAAILTLGCKLNLADSDEIAAGLQSAGFRVVEQLCDADAYVVNTCSVTHVADRKGRRLIRSVRRMAPAAPLAVTGCYPRSAGHERIRALGADLVVGTRDAAKCEIVDYFRDRVASATHADLPIEDRRGAPLRSRAFVKAQEGCNDVCAFCIVPRTRGREESRSPARVAAEVRRAGAAGAREVVITGTQLGAWGRDLPRPLEPADLIGAVLERSDVPRIRFSSLQPQDITPRLLALWDDPRLMPHIHLALQAGSESTLARMRRRYTAAAFLGAVERIRAAIPGVAITTDVIAGFPGETDAEFATTLALCREAGFARIHAFPYSRREKTAANLMDGHVPDAIRKERMTQLLALAEELAAAHRNRFRGTWRPVLWEDEREIDGEARSCGFTDNYIRVYARGAGPPNSITPALLGADLADGLAGQSGGVS